MWFWTFLLPIQRRRKITNGRINARKRLYCIFPTRQRSKETRRRKSKNLTVSATTQQIAEKEVETTKTKDGVVNSVSDGETSGEFTSLAYREDKDTVNMWKEMRTWFRNTDKIEVWIVDLASKFEDGGKEKYDVEYYQGFFKNFEISATGIYFKSYSVR